MTEIHITADKDVWTGASTLALLCAQQAANGVVITNGNSDICTRLTKGGVEIIRCPMSGMLAPLNLSRAMRHISGESFDIYVHSPSVKNAVVSAIKLVGRKEPFNLNPQKLPEFPSPEILRGENIIMWLGNITHDCGLSDLIEEFAQWNKADMKLRIVGQGKAVIVSPILKRVRALGISERIEWVGYAENPYIHMNGVKTAIVKNSNCVAAREFAAVGIPTYTKLSEII